MALITSDCGLRWLTDIEKILVEAEALNPGDAAFCSGQCQSRNPFL